MTIESQMELMGAVNETDAAERMSNWLETLPGIEMARPVELTIKRKKYIASLYSFVQGHRVIEVRTYRLMILGNMTKFRRKNNVFVYSLTKRNPLETCFNETDEWYVCCYNDKNKVSEYAPFGNVWILTLHEEANSGTYQGHKIDTMDDYNPWPRLNMSVKFLD